MTNPMPSSSNVDRFPVGLDAVHAVASEMLTYSLLPAVCVAWADGVIQRAERERIMRYADQIGLGAVPGALQTLHGWLSAPPDPKTTEKALTWLRARDAEAARSGAGIENALRWARSVARADGGFLGVGATSDVEASELERLQRALAGGDADRLTNGLVLARLVGALLKSRSLSEAEFVDHVPASPVSPLPMPSPMNPERLPPAVFSIPESDYSDYRERVVSRYLHTLKHDWWETAQFACAARGVAPMSDSELHRLFFATPFSRFIVSKLDAHDYDLFAQDLAERPSLRAGKVDFSHFESWKPLEGISVAPTVALLDLDAPSDGVLAIAVRGRVFRPEDGESWRRARYFLVQGASIALVVGVHPFLHFPHNSVIAVTRALLPPEHRVARLVEAHAYLHLPLDFGVLWHRRSAARNHQSEPYTALPADWKHVFRSIADHYSGIPGNSAFEGYQYPMGPPAFPGPYGDFLRDYYAVVLDHCRRVADAGAVDADLLRWSEVLSDLLPGFPAPGALSEPDTLARILAGFVHSVAVWHSAEHHAYGKEPVIRVPQRLRVPEPVGNDPATDPATWMHAVDVARQELARRMFYQDSPLRSILEVEYDFVEPSLADAKRQFVADLLMCERGQPVPYIPLARMACSIQY
ncbi:MAG: hypothetical protein CL927_05370 [Deltaproteobacteria bacterium]|nr:hypothetical protein [Deltaproteobacteria bacterium]HCH61829.1 hypothetical protein [Deltaproteobacteria bacterium]